MAGWATVDDLPEHHRAEVRRQLGIVDKQPKTEARKQLERAQRESLSRLFLAHWARWELPQLTAEHRFHPDRKWRLDFCLPDQKIAIEIHGGTRKTYTDGQGVVRQGGRHNRAQGFADDRDKMNAAQLMGWTVFEFTDVMIHDRDVMDTRLQAIKERFEH